MSIVNMLSSPVSAQLDLLSRSYRQSAPLNPKHVLLHSRAGGYSDAEEHVWDDFRIP